LFSTYGEGICQLEAAICDFKLVADAVENEVALPNWSQFVTSSPKHCGRRIVRHIARNMPPLNGAGELFGSGFYKYAAPTALV